MDPRQPAPENGPHSGSHGKRGMKKKRGKRGNLNLQNSQNRRTCERHEERKKKSGMRIVKSFFERVNSETQYGNPDGARDRQKNGEHLVEDRGSWKNEGDHGSSDDALKKIIPNSVKKSGDVFSEESGIRFRFELLAGTFDGVPNRDN
jgi:hypothetical protein